MKGKNHNTKRTTLTHKTQHTKYHESKIPTEPGDKMGDDTRSRLYGKENFEMG